MRRPGLRALASDTGGQATPVAAATWFSAHGGIAGFEGPWHVVQQADGGATLRDGAAQLHTVQGSDGTWQVDAGSCG